MTEVKIQHITTPAIKNKVDSNEDTAKDNNEKKKTETFARKGKKKHSNNHNQKPR